MGYKGVSDFRSDTVTRPTEEMRKAMYKAEVGDDVLGDDPTVQKLEELAAETVGKEAALFVPSGTMGNTIAIKLGSKEGTEVILEEKCHIYNFEAANMARYAGVMPRPIRSENGQMPLEEINKDIKIVLREHIPGTSMICLENTHNYWGGAVLPVEYIMQVKAIAMEHNLHFHLDGARVFNASTALNIDVKEITKHFDTIMFCLSKGLCAPVGSILAGSKEFIKQARFLRKSLGGGMRQAGILAAAGIIAIEKMSKRLEEDHIRAKKLAEGIADLKKLQVDLNSVQTNFVMVELEEMPSFEFLEELKKEGVLALPFSETRVRFVTHNDIDDRDVEKAIKAIRKILK